MLGVDPPAGELQVVAARSRRPRRPRGARCPRPARPPAGRFGRRGQHRVALGPDLRLLVGERAAPGGERRELPRAARGSGRPCSARLAWFCSARSASSSVVSARQRSSSSSSRSIASAAPGPRRASAARTASGSRRISRRSSNYFLLGLRLVLCVPCAVAECGPALSCVPGTATCELVELEAVVVVCPGCGSVPICC